MVCHSAEVAATFGRQRRGPRDNSNAHEDDACWHVRDKCVTYKQDLCDADALISMHAVMCTAVVVHSCFYLDLRHRGICE